MLYPVLYEEMIRDDRRGTWEYVHDTDDGQNKYLHRNCDAVTDKTGHCIMCGRPSPTLWARENALLQPTSRA